MSNELSAQSHEITGRLIGSSKCERFLQQDWERNKELTVSFTQPVMTAAEALLYLKQAGPEDLDFRFHQFIVAAQEGHEIAVRILTQALMPKLILVGTSMKNLRSDDRDDQLQEILSYFIQSIHKYPLDKTHKVIGNLVLRTLNRTIRSVDPQSSQMLQSTHPLEQDMLLWHSDNHAMMVGHSLDQPGSKEQTMLTLMNLLDAAKKAGVLTEEEARHIGSYTVQDHGERKAYAAENGMSTHHYAVRVFRSKKKLAKFVTTSNLSREDFS